jgi:uncharacterized protein (TIGR00290 family)
MLSEGGEFSHSHGLPKALIEAQAEMLGMKPVFRSASWERYEAEFVSALHEFRKSGIEAGVFGDIDVDAHLEWTARVCASAGLVPVLPLWKRERRALLEEFIGLGFEAWIIAVNAKKLDGSFLGKTIQAETIKEMEEAGIDPSGEGGEYHTVVTGGPIFSSKIDISVSGPERHGDYLYLRVGRAG